MLRDDRIRSHRATGGPGDTGNGGEAEKIPARRMGGQRYRVPSRAVITDWTVTKYSSWR
jgi:hypothetical protein